MFRGLFSFDSNTYEFFLFLAVAAVAGVMGATGGFGLMGLFVPIPLIIFFVLLILFLPIEKIF